MVFGIGKWVSSELDKWGNVLAPVINKADTVLKWTGVAMCAGTFAQGAIGCATLFNVYQGVQAQRKLTEFYTKIGHDVEAIRDNLGSINTNFEVLVNNVAQQDFGVYVHDYVKMRQKQLAAARGNDLLFVYHPGNEWHGKFHNLLDDKPISQLCGIFDNLDILAAWLRVIRKVVGPGPKFHVLMPAAEVYYVDQDITWPEEVFPMVFEGQTRNRGGTPYVHFNMPGAAPEIFSCVKNLADEPVIAPPKPSVWKKVASTSAAWGAGVPAAVVATPGGLVVGFLGCAVLAPIAAPGALIAGVVCGSGIAAGAAAGTITGLFTGSLVEKAWDS